MSVTNEHVASMLLIQQGFQDIPESVFHEDIKSDLDAWGFAHLTSSGWYLTDTGKDFLYTNNVSRSMTKAELGNYDKTIANMSDSAVNALTRAQINAKHGFYNRLGPTEIRILMQHLLNIQVNKRMGKELIGKWYSALKESVSYFRQRNNEAPAQRQDLLYKPVMPPNALPPRTRGNDFDLDRL